MIKLKANFFAFYTAIFLPKKFFEKNLIFCDFFEKKCHKIVLNFVIYSEGSDLENFIKDNL